MKFNNAEETPTLERVPPAKIAGGGGGCLISQHEIADAIFEENRRCLIADFYKHLAEDYSAQARANGLLAKMHEQRFSQGREAGKTFTLDGFCASAMRKCARRGEGFAVERSERKVGHS